MELNKELLAKAKEAKTPEELIALAKENGTELTAESAKMYFDLLHPQTGELSDDELDNVSGGGCYGRDDCLLTTIGHKCRHFEHAVPRTGVSGTCGACHYWDRTNWCGLEVVGAPLRCLNPKNSRRK